MVIIVLGRAQASVKACKLVALRIHLVSSGFSIQKSEFVIMVYSLSFRGMCEGALPDALSMEINEGVERSKNVDLLGTPAMP